MTDTTSQLDGPAIGLASPVQDSWSTTTWFAVVSMAATSFALVSAEFLPAGMLTPMARDLGISEGTAGQVVTATASVGAVAALLSNVLIGKLISDSDQEIVLETDRVAGTKEEIRRANVEQIKPASLSPMPEGLVNILSKDEIFDLLAYLRGGAGAASAVARGP